MDSHKQQQDDEHNFHVRCQAEKAPASSGKVGQPTHAKPTFQTQSDFIWESLQQQAGLFTGPMSSGYYGYDSISSHLNCQPACAGTPFSGTPTFGSDFSFNQSSNFNSSDLPGDLASPSTNDKDHGREPWLNSGREGSVSGSGQSSKHPQDGSGSDDSGDDRDDDSEGGNPGGGGGDDPPPPDDDGRGNGNGDEDDTPDDMHNFYLLFCTQIENILHFYG
ncbi:hypothetical protein Moror_9889 [Moniliophthora roreri MCA 2997]|uniref:Uncharacterized protein n=1 Tax=Moniliophthora roreri (strain MCA 2997) TaxID=1381753 RepID=V2Y4C5_MONRO|nr:hypothetical protein Moror_9889 [Moniliophthora roreri MCA 2997]